MKNFAFETNIDANEFSKMDNETLTEKLYEEIKNFYNRKLVSLREQTLPILQNIYTQNGKNIERIGVPFSDGHRGMQVVTNLEESVKSEGKSLIVSVEKQITLGLIDDAWKTHLRQMDEMKQSVQLASYEQKDPLLIYKLEAFNLFRDMINDTNKSISSFLCRCGIVENEADAKEAKVAKTDMSKMHANKDEIDSRGDDYAANENDYYNPTPVKQDPIKREEPKIGRNDLCPCGSGKKYKQCHGK